MSNHDDYIIVLLLIILLIVCSSCSTRSQTTVFYKEDEAWSINLQGDHCQQSGIKVNESDLTLTEFFKNCDVHKIRKLKDYELPQWGIKPPKGRVGLE